MRSYNTSKLSNDLFLEEYTPEFVDRWDELINWKRRHEAENGFFARVLREHGAKKVLDIACGTGFHTVTLSLAGFQVTGSDGAPTMVSKAQENAERFGLNNVRVLQAEWTSLTEAFPNEKFDAIVCLGNAFTHLFEEADRLKALKEIFELLKKDGVAIIDQRNYDAILDRGFQSKHHSYYLGESVTVRPETISDQAVKLLYEYEDGAVHHLTLCPIRQDYMTDLLWRTGFRHVERYGDFQPGYDFYDPDFIIHVAKK